MILTEKGERAADSTRTSPWDDRANLPSAVPPVVNRFPTRDAPLVCATELQQRPPTIEAVRMFDATEASIWYGKEKHSVYVSTLSDLSLDDRQAFRDALWIYVQTYEPQLFLVDPATGTQLSGYQIYERTLQFIDDPSSQIDQFFRMPNMRAPTFLEAVDIGIRSLDAAVNLDFNPVDIHPLSQTEVRTCEFFDRLCELCEEREHYLDDAATEFESVTTTRELESWMNRWNPLIDVAAVVGWSPNSQRPPFPFCEGTGGLLHAATNSEFFRLLPGREEGIVDFRGRARSIYVLERAVSELNSAASWEQFSRRVSRIVTAFNILYPEPEARLASVNVLGELQALPVGLNEDRTELRNSLPSHSLSPRIARALVIRARELLNPRRFQDQLAQAASIDDIVQVARDIGASRATRFESRLENRELIREAKRDSRDLEEIVSEIANGFNRHSVRDQEQLLFGRLPARTSHGEVVADLHNAFMEHIARVQRVNRSAALTYSARKSLPNFGRDDGWALDGASETSFENQVLSKARERFAAGDAVHAVLLLSNRELLGGLGILSESSRSRTIPLRSPHIAVSTNQEDLATHAIATLSDVGPPAQQLDRAIAYLVDGLTVDDVRYQQSVDATEYYRVIYPTIQSLWCEAAEARQRQVAHA